MAKKQSAGILLYRKKGEILEVFLVHPGGPFWKKKKDLGSWTIPKGEFLDDEDPLAAAIREFQEETGFTPNGPFTALSPVLQKSGKKVWAWAAAGDLVPALMRSNTVTLHWPPGSGKKISFPEVDRGEWFTLDIAKEKINPAQVALLQELSHLSIHKSI